MASVFLSVEVLVLRAAQQSSPGGLMAEVAMDLVKRVLADYGKEVFVHHVTLTVTTAMVQVTLLLSGTNTAHQAKAVIRMLTAMVALSTEAAR